MERHRLRSQGLIWREVEEEIIILDMEASLYASVNAAGRMLWLRLAEGASLDELASALEGEFGLERTRARADAAAFLGALKSQGLLA